MTQSELFYDDIHSALRATVEMLGGTKKVGSKLWPALSVAAAQTELLHCLNPEKNRKLSLDELMAVWRWSREQGIHILAEFIGQEFGYEIKPITREQKQAALLERYEAMRAEVLSLAKAMQSL